MNSLVNNKGQAVARKQTFGAYITQDGIAKFVNKTVGSEKGQKFIAAITSAVSANPALQECDHSTILSAALIGESLNLSPSPIMGHEYFVPFKDTRNQRIVAQFQIGYKGFLQLAMRSGQYKTINVLEIKEGEFKGRDSKTGEEIFEFISDDVERESKNTIGYLAYFELINGYRHSLYWTKKHMEEHAKTYSKGYASDLKNGTAYTFWSKNFTQMAYKTMLRRLISVWGIMSIDLEKALTTDQGVVYDDRVDFVDAPNNNNIDFEPITNETADNPKEDKKITKTEDIIEAYNKQEFPSEQPKQQSLFDALKN